MKKLYHLYWICVDSVLQLCMVFDVTETRGLGVGCL